MTYQPNGINFALEHKISKLLIFKNLNKWGQIQIKSNSLSPVKCKCMFIGYVERDKQRQLSTKTASLRRLVNN
jgi:hypothetical protein